MTTYSVHPRRLLPQSLDGGPSAGIANGAGARLPPSIQQRLVGNKTAAGTPPVAGAVYTNGGGGAAVSFENSLNGSLNAPGKQSLSDCGGSSSGFGGMTKGEIVSSDESSLASDAPVGVKGTWVAPHPVLLNNTNPPLFMSCNTVPTSSTSPTPMYYDQMRNNIGMTQQRAPSSVGSNDLFVHVQTGETLSIVIGNDIQHITGPATVRMVNQAGMSPSALPLHVPPGHMVQQMVDEQGILRHLILSPEASPISRHIPTAPPPPAINPATPIQNSCAPTSLKHFVHSSPSPPIVPPYPPPTVLYPILNNEYVDDSLRKTWIPQTKKFGGAHVIHVATNNADDHEQSQSGASANEEEEWERLTEMLSRMQPPQVLRVTSRDADIAWQELDTSEASAIGGPFPQIDPSEFTYEIVLFEGAGRVVSSYRCEPETGNHRVRLGRLRPNADYMVQLRASLEERGLQGDLSPAVKFRTRCAQPECPHPPRFVTSTPNSLTIAWRPPPDNGSPITAYRIEIQTERLQNEEDQYAVVFEGLAEQTRLKDLIPATRYQVRLIAINGEGDSSPSAPVIFQTAPAIQPPRQPNSPQVISSTNNSVKLSWCALAQHFYTLEMSDSQANQFSPVHERIQQSTASVSDLLSNHQYQFRLIAHNDKGNSEPSEPLIVRTRASPPPTPSQPHVIVCDATQLKIGWRPDHRKTGNDERDSSLLFTVEGSSDEQIWNVVYKGTATSVQVYNPDLRAFRVAARRRQKQSSWSEILRVRREQKRELVAPGQCSTPTIVENANGCLRVQWTPPDGIPSSFIYQLHRLNSEQPGIIYQGKECMFDAHGIAPGEEFEVQLRAVAIGTDGARAEGAWSRVAIARASVQPPSPPTDVYVDTNNVLHWSPPNSTNGSPITEYIVERTLIRSSTSRAVDGENDQTTSADPGWTIKREGANIHSLSVAEGLPGCKYQLSVSAMNSGGTSVSSECIYVSIPPRSPTAPTLFHALPQGCRQLQASWRAPCSNGSELIEYNIRVIDDASGEVVRLIKQPPTSCECVIESLEPDHTYRLSVCGVNSIGVGDVCWKTATTSAPPPQPPNLICSEAASNYLKLKWKPPGCSSPSNNTSYYYYLEKENDSGKFSPIYEGENRYTKVRNLSESTKYRFRIRCSSRMSGAGPWSSPIEFSTEQLPPPTIRCAPSVTEVASGSFQVEWQPVRTSNSDPKSSLFYRLQLALRTASDRSNGTWKTVYEGACTSYSLTTSECVQLRVQCVRVRDGVECVSAPSAVQFVSPSPSSSSARTSVCSTTVVAEQQRSQNTTSPELNDLRYIRYHILSDKHYAIVILMLFAVLAFAVALALDALLFSKS